MPDWSKVWSLIVAYKLLGYGLIICLTITIITNKLFTFIVKRKIEFNGANKIMKFEKVLNNELREAVDIIQRIKSLSNDCWRQLSCIVYEGKNKEDKFYETAVHFTRINIEAIDAIFNLLKKGNITESVVLLRWQLEIGHLFFYLSYNKEQYDQWLSGTQFRPKIIGEFLEKKGLASWKDMYTDWSNVTHGNSLYVENCAVVSKMTPLEKDQIILLSQLLRNLMFTSHKITNVVGLLLKPVLQTSEYNKITIEYNKLEEQILKFSEEHNVKENIFINS